MERIHIPALVAIAVLVASCDAGIAGESFENQPPDTQLSVRDESLVDNLGDAGRLASTVAVSWTGSDPDGYVSAYEIRITGADAPAGSGDWTRTVAVDTLVLLPIPRGERTADVTFEARALDNEGLADPTPARTVFPIQNAPPTIRINPFELPPDTTFGVFSFAWTAEDPEGADNLDRIEVSLNDTLDWQTLPATAAFATFVTDAGGDAEVYVGRAFQPAGVTVEGVQFDAPNTFYVRAVDLTDTTSMRAEYTWYVKAQTSDVLLVNDHRKDSFPVVQTFHMAILREALPPGYDVDVWNLSYPFMTGSTGNVPRSSELFSAVEPTLQQTLARWKYIYWISTNTVNAITGNNLPFVAPGLDLFFENGGKLMVLSPMTQPQNPEDNLGNPAILLLPVSGLFVRPDTLQRLELGRGAAIRPVGGLPGVPDALPELESQNFYINELPFYAQGSTILPLYEADYRYRTRSGTRGDWPGPKTIASISADGRVGLFALPLVSEVSGEPLVVGSTGDAAEARRAVGLMLRSLGFPSR